MHTQWRDCQELRKHGIPLSTTSDQAAKLYDAAVTQTVAYRDEPSVGGLEHTLEELSKADPHWVMGHVLSLGMDIMYVRRQLHRDAALQGDLDTMMTLCQRPEVTIWEKLHAEAIVHWANDRKSEACRLYEEILLDHPHDVLAVQSAHVGYLYLGDKTRHRGLVGQLLLDWHPRMPLYGYLLGIHSFGLVDVDSLREAELYANQALELNRFDGMASHTLAHVYHGTGRARDGASFLARTEAEWTVGEKLARHNYWHWALLEIEQGDYASAMGLFDDQVLPRVFSNGTFGVVDGASLLKRLEFQGVDVGDRWHQIYDVARPQAGNHAFPSSDLHIMMAYLGKGNQVAKAELLSSSQEFSRSGSGDCQSFMRTYGCDLMEAFAAADGGDYAKAVDLLHPIRHPAGLMGGSKLQSDLLNLFLIDAGLKSPDDRHRKLAKQLVSQRRGPHDDTPLTERLVQRVMDPHVD